MDLEKLRRQEDEALRLTESWPRSFQLIIYEILNRRHNCTMANIESERIREFNKEEKGLVK